MGDGKHGGTRKESVTEQGGGAQRYLSHLLETLEQGM